MPTPAPTPSKLTVDFSKVTEGGGGAAAHVPEGDYLLQVEACELKTKSDQSSKYLNWRSSVVKPEKYKGKTIYSISSLKEENLWSLRNFLIDLGINIPKSAVDIPLRAIVAKHPQFGATLADDSYEKNGQVKTKSIITAHFPKAQYGAETEAADDSSDDDDEDEAEGTAAEETTDELDLDDL